MSEEFQSPIAIKIPITLETTGEEKIRGKQQDHHVKTQKKFEKIQHMKANGILGVLEKDLGASKAAEALGFLRNPADGIFRILGSQLGRMIPIVAAIMALPQIIDLVNNLLFSKGGPFDRTFRNTINTLNNQMRNREQQQSIRSGFTQVIFTTNAGTTDPRDSYNSYEQKENNTTEFQSLRNIRGIGNVN